MCFELLNGIQLTTFDTNFLKLVERLRQKWNLKHILLPERAQTSSEKLFKCSYFKVNVMELICTLNLHFNVRLKPTRLRYILKKQICIFWGKSDYCPKLGLVFGTFTKMILCALIQGKNLFCFIMKKTVPVILELDLGPHNNGENCCRRNLSTIYLDSYYLNMYTTVENYGDKTYHGLLYDLFNPSSPISL